MIHTYSAVIFAGGKSSRMGKDKSLLPFAHYSTLSEFQQERLKPWFKKVYISAKENKFDFTCEYIEDKTSVSSPLIGLLSILESIEEDEVFVLSVDAPFVDKNVMEKFLTVIIHLMMLLLRKVLLVYNHFADCIKSPFYL